jgi:integrase
MQDSRLIETASGVHELQLNGSRVKIRETKNGQYKFFRLEWKVGSQTFRRAFSSSEKAIDEAERIVRDLARAEGEKTTVRSEDIVYFRECARKLGGVPLHEAVDFYCKFHRIGAPRKTIAEIGQELEVASRAREASKRHIETIIHINKVWTKWAGAMTPSEISPSLIERKFAESDYSPHTKKNLLRGYRAIELFAIRQKYLPREFESVADRVTIPKTRNATPAVFTPEDLMRLFIAAGPRHLSYVAMMAFAGARRAEFERMTRDHISLDDKVAVINAEIAKKGSRRVLELPDNLCEWLRIANLPEKGLLTSRKNIERLSSNKAALKEVGLDGSKWEQNVLRHSFCSYHLAMHRNAATTSEQAGNSPQMLREHYKSLVTPAAAKEWFDITPDKVMKFAIDHHLVGLIKWNCHQKGEVTNS